MFYSSSRFQIVICLCNILHVLSHTNPRTHKQALHPRAMPKEVLRGLIEDLAAAGGDGGGTETCTSTARVDGSVGGGSSCTTAGRVQTDGDIRSAVLHSMEASTAIVHAAISATLDGSVIIDNAVATTVAADAVVIVCGSAFIMAEARAALGVREPRDSDALSSTFGSTGSSISGSKSSSGVVGVSSSNADVNDMYPDAQEYFAPISKPNN